MEIKAMEQTITWQTNTLPTENTYVLVRTPFCKYKFATAFWNGMEWRSADDKSEVWNVTEWCYI
jgi:hypothetical protein